MFKKIIISLLSATLFMSTIITVSAENNTLTSNKPLDKITVLYNGEPIGFDVEPTIISDRTMVPLRAIFEKIGAIVSWEGQTQTVFSILDDKIVSLQINNALMFVNDTKIELDVPAQIVNDRTLVPLRAVSEAFDCKVEWNEDTKTVTIVK